MHPVLQQQDKMCARRFGAPNVEKDSCRADKYSEAAKNAKVGACRHDQGPQKPEGYLWVKWNYLFCIHMVGLTKTLVSEMVKWREAEERMAAVLEWLMKWVEEMETELDGEESEKSEVREGKD